ncbi:MAG: hypothetical protein ACK501_09910 [Planctomycetota bacterium]|jgi:hypothetical protein
MQQKLCLWMAMVVLFGALCVGNPFLACRDGTSPVEPTTAAAPSTERLDPAVAKRAPTNPDERGNDAASRLPEGAVSALSARSPEVALASNDAVAPKATLASDQNRSRRGPVEAAIELTPVVPRPTPRNAAAEDLDCPDAELRPLVARTERHDGVLVWVLHDGRRFRRNPKPTAGEPLLVPFVVVADDRPE